MLLGTSLLITILGVFALGILTGVSLGYGIAARFVAHTEVIDKVVSVRKLRRG